MADWPTISALATAGGTLALAGVTLAAVRSANRAARVAERSLLAGLRPLLITSRLDDAPQKVNFVDGKVVVARGGGAAVEATDEAVYLAMSLRNAGAGIAVLHGWWFHPEPLPGPPEHAEPEQFVRLSRDIYVPVDDAGFWQGSFRDPRSPEYAAARETIDARRSFTIELLYSDQEGGQRVISRFALLPRDDGSWGAAAGRHWNLDRSDPR